MAHTPKEGTLKDILFGVQVGTKVQEHSEQGNRSRRAKKDRQVSLEKDHHKQASMDLKNLHKHLDVEDPRSLVNTILDELPTNNKFRLSPLAARAALASLVSTTQEDNAADGSKEFGSNVSKKLFMVNDLSSEDPSSDSVEIVTDSVNCEKEVKSSKRGRSFEKSSGKKGKQAKVECRTPEVIVSGGTSTTRRTTRSASQKSGGCDVSNDIIKTQSPSEDVPKKSSTARRMTRSTITDVKEEFTSKPEMVDVEMIQTTKTASSKRNRAKKSIEAQEGAVESLIVSADKKVQEQSPLNVNNSRQSKADSAKKTPEPELPVRVTRSALQRGTFNANAIDDVQMTSEEKTQAKGSVKTRRSTRSTNLEEREDPVKGQEDLDANMNPAQTEGKGDNRKRSASTTKRQEVHQVVMGLRVTRSKSKS